MNSDAETLFLVQQEMFALNIEINNAATKVTQDCCHWYTINDAECPAVPPFNLASHEACDTVAVLSTRPAINHREPEGSKEHPSVANYS